MSRRHEVPRILAGPPLGHVPERVGDARRTDVEAAVDVASGALQVGHDVLDQGVQMSPDIGVRVGDGLGVLVRVGKEAHLQNPRVNIKFPNTTTETSEMRVWSVFCYGFEGK